MLPRGPIAVQRLYNSIEVFIVTKEIRMFGIHDKCGDVVLADIIRISLLDIKQVMVTDIFFIVPVPLPDIFLEFIYGCMEVNQNIGLDELLIDDIKQPLVQPEFFFG